MRATFIPDLIISFSVSTDREAGPMVQMMPVLRAVMGAESMSSRHMCSRNVSAMAACSCCVWMKADPASLWDFDMASEVVGPGRLEAETGLIRG